MSTVFPMLKGVLLSSKHYTWNTADSLGRGASATVYLGRQRESGLVVAVKSFHKHAYSTRQADLREQELLRQLDHENIIRLLAIEFEETHKDPVLIMEYCEGGSLHHMLEQPVYHYGLPEHEYLLVLTHVACGMRYLRNVNVIHRDIKPGNIMRFITGEGVSVYKLTDFGAARNLDDDQQFDSLYGTEEYLHPGVYERAVLRHPTGNSFDARVDLWSLGVTFYHAATGQLPFQPYGGRSNKETMFQIISEKESGVISGQQKKKNGPIDWSRELPDSCPLSSGLRSIVTPLLAGLMEPSQAKMISYDLFFGIVDGIGHNITVPVFHLAYGQEVIFYVEKSFVLSDLQDRIASLIDIPASEQILLLDGKRLEDLVDPKLPISDYPVEILEEGIFLFYSSSKENVRMKEPELYPFPNIGTYAGMDMDYRHANLAYAQGQLISRYAEQSSKRQELLIKGVNCLRLYVESRQAAHQASLDLMHRLMKEFELHLETFFDMAGLLRHLVTSRHPVNLQDKELLGDILNDQVIRPVFYKAQERLKEISEYNVSTNAKISNLKQSAASLVAKCKKDKCGEKISHHLSIVSGIQSRFRRDKNVRHQMTAHDENIHHFERQKLHSHCAALKTLVTTHCFAQQKALYNEAFKIADKLTQKLSHVTKIEVNMTSVLNCQKLLREKIVKKRQTCKDMVSDHRSSGFASWDTEASLRCQNSSSTNSLTLPTGFSANNLAMMSHQAHNLEAKLNDLKHQLEANTEYFSSVVTTNLDECDKETVPSQDSDNSGDKTLCAGLECASASAPNIT